MKQMESYEGDFQISDNILFYFASTRTLKKKKIGHMLFSCRFHTFL